MTLATTRLITGLAALAAALTAAGCSCGGDDYFCDDSGCYYCDGLGCRDAEAPPRADCTGDWQCSGGEVCTADGCTQSCGLDDECPDGTICNDSGFCLSPGSEAPVLQPGVCAVSEDCGAGGLCQDGLCIADPGQEDPGIDPGTDPGTDPGEDPGEDPGSDPGEDPGTDPGEDPGSDPGEDPGQDPGGEVPIGPAPQCTMQSECSLGWDCMNAICKLGCSNDAQCGLGCACNEDGWCTGPGYDQ